MWVDLAPTDTDNDGDDEPRPPGRLLYDLNSGPDTLSSSEDQRRQ